MTDISSPFLALGGGAISAVVGNVTLHINSETEEQYIRTVAPFNPKALLMAVNRAHAHGYELMDEYDESDDGTVVTHWLEQAVFPSEDAFAPTTITEREAVA